MGNCRGQHLDVRGTQRCRVELHGREEARAPLSSAIVGQEPRKVLRESSPQLDSQTVGSEAPGQFAAGSEVPTTGLVCPASSLS